jgi:site-specific recombinase XerC
VLAALFVGGLRRAEAVALNVKDYDVATGHLTVIGKGRRQRRTALPAGGRRAMTAWLEVRGGRPPVLPGRQGSSRLLRLSSRPRTADHRGSREPSPRIVKRSRRSVIV